jgi:two-component system, cell cycle response regulator DivK
MAARRGNSRQPPPARSGARLRPPFVLVVDDTPDNREMYMEYLRFAGYRVAGVADGASAIDAARELRPSVILMDLSLPGIDGWEATRILKTDPGTRDILIIALTGHAEPECRRRAMLAGCDSFIPKPSLPADIAAEIVRLLDGGARGRSSAEETSAGVRRRR